jgi:hypothetical protein
MSNFGLTKKPQRDKVLDALWDCKWHTFRELSQVGGIRYSARLLELKRLGYKIEDREMSIVLDKVDGKEYRLTSRTPGAPQGKKVKVFLDERDANALLEGPLPSNNARRALRTAYQSFVANKDRL